MIKAKITSKAVSSLERELHQEIHQLYHDLHEAGISKSPKNILRQDDKDLDVQPTARSAAVCCGAFGLRGSGGTVC